jgi:NagD protein
MTIAGRFGYLLDMDGVLYRGEQPIAGAAQFVHALRDRDIPFLFLTNNSANTPREYVAKLGKMGIDIAEHHIYSCAMATAEFLAGHAVEKTAFVIGENGLTSALHQVGFELTAYDAEYVIVGEGRSFSFEAAEKATNMLLAGAKLVATNLDPSCPTAGGHRPGCGAIVALLETAVQSKAFSVGKPSPFMMRAARKRLQLRTEETIMVGDTMETDIRGAVEVGFHSVLVLTGNTRREDLARYPYRPTVVVDSIGDLMAMEPLQRVA